MIKISKYLICTTVSLLLTALYACALFMNVAPKTNLIWFIATATSQLLLLITALIKEK